MSVLAFILAVIAAVLFGAEYARGKSFVALGLLFLTVAWIAQLAIGGNAIHLT